VGSTLSSRAHRARGAESCYDALADLPMRFLLVLVVVSMTLIAPGDAVAEKDWFVTLLGGQYAASTLLSLPAGPDLKDSYALGLSVSKEFAEWLTHMRWEAELQVLKHFGEQENWEFVGSINLRWVTFPWNRYLETTFALGGGLSVATEIPELEKTGPTNSDPAALLHYILIEATFALPNSHWSVVTRIHHRSGVFGLFSHSGSNILAAGLRYRF
jgi:hypothetical protein